MEQFLVTFLCSQLTLWAGNQYNSACANFTNATLIQSGIHSEISQVQQDVEKYGIKTQKIVEEETGETPWRMAAVGYSAYTVYRQNFQLSTPLRPYIDTVSINANSQTKNINFSWTF